LLSEQVEISAQPLWQTQAAVSLPTDKIGKTYPSAVYAVGREKVREYAAAVGETNPLHHDLEAARAAGYGDVLAPPMFAVVYCSSPFLTALFDPELRIDFAHLVHGAQEFRWEQPVMAGDEITTTLTVANIAERAGLRFDTFETVSTNQRGETTCVGTWSTIVRGEE
jgi:acyl dehydratase